MTTVELINKRRYRAMALTAHVLHVVGKYIAHNSDRDPMQALARELQEKLEAVGAEIVTDFDRREYGLPPRGPDGWTMEEIVELEKRRLESMYATRLPPILTTLP